MQLCVKEVSLHWQFITINGHTLPANIQCFPDIPINTSNFAGNEFYCYRINHRLGPLQIAAKSILHDCCNLLLRVGWEVEELGLTLVQPW